MSHKKTKLKRSVGIRQLYRRISKDVTAILGDIRMKERNYNIINVTTSNSNSNESTNNSNCFVPQKETLHIENSALCNLDITDNTVSDADLYDSDSTVTNPLLVQDNPALSPLQNDLSTKLQHWATSYKISHSALTSLLHIISPHCPELPFHSRTLLKTPTSMQSKQLENGEYCHFGLANELKNFLAQNTTFSAEVFKIGFNVDGLPLFRSSNIQFWPILGIVKNTIQSTTPFTIGIFCGTSKPIPLEKFLDDFINELSYLLKEGIEFYNKKYSVEVHSFVCDAPAKAYLKRIKSHSGYSSCDKCTEYGDYIQRKVIMRNISASKRTDESFKLQTDENHHIGKSPLLKLEIGLLVSSFPIDYMHCVCLGVVRKLIHSWVNGQPLQVKLSSRSINTISERLILLKHFIPIEINRKPRSLSELQRWKATEMRTFLLYTGSVVLKNVVDEAIYQHFSLLHCAITILISKKHISKFTCGFADELLKIFVNHCENIYGLEFYVYNIHMLSHLSNDVERFGPLDEFSAFVFESYLGQLKQTIKSPNKPLQQIYRRLKELSVTTNKCLTTKSSLLYELEHIFGPLSTTGFHYKQFKKLRFEFFTLTIKRHSSADCYCLTKDNLVLQILNIVVGLEGEILIIGKYFLSYDSFYSYPIESKNFHIFQVKNLSLEIHTWSYKIIIAKCILLPIIVDKIWISFPTIHSLSV